MGLITPPNPETMPELNVIDGIRARAKETPEKEAIVCGDIRQSWAEFDQRSNRCANALIELGIDKGDRVAILSPNSAPYAEIFIGTLKAGACIVPLSTMASSEALEKMVVDSGSKVLFLADHYRDLVAPFLENLNARLVALDFDAAGFTGYEDLLARQPETDPVIAVDWDDPFNIIYSSGTTGTPKGILHSNWMRAVQMERAEPSGYCDNARTLLSTPLYSNTTIVSFLPTLFGGSTVHLMGKFDARRYLEIAEEEQITHTMLVPVQYKRIMDIPEFDDFDLTSMRVKFSTSAPLRADVKADVLARFPGKLIEYYGLTEGGGVTILVADETPDKLHTVGAPGPGTEIKLIDVDGNEVPKGQVGEICGRSPAMMAGYFGRDDLTNDYIWHDGDGRLFFRTGDMGHFDEDGFLILSDRKKDMIISGGLNIYANDLELILLRDPTVIDAAVIGVPSEQWGETPLGLVVRKPGSDKTVEDILTDANALLGKSHRLSGIELRDTLPRSSIGKILKRELRTPYWQ
ncbi:Long-chain-fatty-acid--CoA ligase FadD13 [Thalassovita gelatinovora]|uniref:Long-chain-fatty-acid--CoA ligase FadD13 n=1 Tax=Thalassovita gelatinovora TaxID=53501 RepID=A0A0P1FVW5_THAGE|nr:class I adenylate-forming enzyme family protein [Thalassovita gelatinovora]QIZ81143.1 acyl--CoA ligase [Thalassovita gelatinovora]CUH64822.1 Long-chain-fatty-acid--CoA ligase FadD13 [Thalassovita gelatinovora]SEP91453.1 Acyl-CoA synthetase (AMP-forming)/AMP-acid ligase II [Thalassovita gelatinovora]